MSIRAAGSVELTRTDGWVLGWWAVNLVVFSHVVLVETPLWLTYAYNGLLYAIGVGLAAFDRRIRHLVVLGTVTGIVELGVDHFLVAYTGTLVYPDSLPMLLSSPLYMPLAWAIVTVHVGYLALRIGEVAGDWPARIVPALAAIAVVGFYETGAYDAGIWEYVDAPLLMVAHAPLYIVAAEGIMFATLYEFARRDRPVLGGVGFGLVVTASYVLTYALFAALGG